jgi:hypothetical protein
MTVIKTSNQDIKLVDATTNHPKFKKVMDLMKGESVKTVEKLLFEVIKSSRDHSKVSFKDDEDFKKEPKKVSKHI